MKIFTYNDYRTYLHDYIGTQSQGIKKEIATAMGISPSLLSQILSGDRSLNNDQAYRFAKHLSFNSTETSYLLLLLDHENAASENLKSFYKTRIAEIQEDVETNERVRLGLNKAGWSPEFMSGIYSSWHCVAMYCALPLEKIWTIPKMAQRLGLTEKRVTHIFEFFLEHKVVEKLSDSEFRLSETNYTFISGPVNLAQQSSILHNCKNFRRKAMEVFEEEHMNKDRTSMFQTVTALISAEDYELLRTEIKDLFTSYNKKIAKANFEKIVCLNVDYFTL